MGKFSKNQREIFKEIEASQEVRGWFESSPGSLGYMCPQGEKKSLLAGSLKGKDSGGAHEWTKHLREEDENQVQRGT